MLPSVTRQSPLCRLSPLVLLLVCVSGQSQSTSKRGPSSSSARSVYGTPEPMQNMAMPLVAPVFLQTNQIDSNITVVNAIMSGVQGTITLRDQHGNVIAQQARTFPQHSSTPVAVKSLLAAGGSHAYSGSVTLEQDPAVKGPALVAQLSMTMQAGSQPAFLEEEFGMPTPHGSAVLRGVASRTQNLPLIAVTSISAASQSIYASCVGENSADTAIQLPAYGTAVVQACTWKGLPDASLNLSSSLLASSPSPAADHAVSLKTDSVPGSFYAFGFALNGGIGQAQLQPLDFYDPGMLGSSSIVYVGVPIGAVPLFSTGLSAPVLTVANFSAQPRTTSVTLSDSSSGTPKVQQIAQVTTPAFSTQTLNLTGATGSGILNTVTITSDGSPGDVQAHLFTRLGSSEQRTELLAKDSRDNHNGGDHPWSVENGNTSTLLLYNSSAKPQEFQVRISGSGSSWVDLYQLAPYETKSVSINDIVVKAIPDHKKNTLPTSLSNGEVQWSTSFGASGLGRLLVTNPATSLARSFSCPAFYNMCSASFGPENFLDITLDGADTLSLVQPVFCTEYCDTCCSQTSPVGQTYSFTTQWQGGDSAQTQTQSSTDSSLTLKGVGLGSFSVSASVQAGACYAPSMGGGGNVVVPDHMTYYSDFTGHSTVRDPNRCNANSNYAVLRVLQFQVYAGQQHVGSIPVQEVFNTTRADTCTTATPPGETFAYTNVDGVFTDQLSTNACAPPDSYTCGFTIDPDTWNYAPVGAPNVPIGKLTYVVNQSSVSVNGTTAQLPPGVTVPK